MLVLLIGLILGLIFTYLYRKRMKYSNVGIKRIGMYLGGLFLSTLYSLFLISIFSIIAPVEYYASKIERIGAIKTVQQIHGNFNFGFGEIKADFYYRCMAQHEDAGIYAINIPADITVIYEDTNTPQVVTINARNPGLWQFLTFPDNEVYAYAIHVAPGTTIPGEKIQ